MNDINLTAIMRRDRVQSIYQSDKGGFSVHLFGGGFGTGRTVGEAMANAQSHPKHMERTAA